MGLCFSINREHRRLLKVDRSKTQKRTFNGQIRIGIVDSIYDGDTVTIITRLHPGEPYAKYSLRLSGFDAPEVSPRSTTPHRALHKSAGLAVRDYLNSYIPVGSVVQITFEKEEKYGRLLGTIHKLEYSRCYMKYVVGENVNEHLLNNYMVLPYTGDTKGVFDEATLERIIKSVRTKTTDIDI